MFHTTFTSMHTRFDLVLPGIGTADGEHIAGQLQELLGGLEKMLSRFFIGGALWQLNEYGAKRSIKLPDELYRLLQQCLDWREKTCGYFDVLYSGMAEGSLSVNTQNLHANQLLTLLPEGVAMLGAESAKLDLGGVGKGYALDKAVKLLKGLGIADGFLSFGESSIYVLGNHPYGKGWPVGIANTYQPAELVQSFVLTEMAVSTSGFRPLESDVFHSVNPFTGALLAKRKTATVIGQEAAVCEVLSTAIYLAPESCWGTIFANFEKYSAFEVQYSDTEIISQRFYNKQF